METIGGAGVWPGDSGGGGVNPRSAGRNPAPKAHGQGLVTFLVVTSRGV